MQSLVGKDSSNPSNYWHSEHSIVGEKEIVSVEKAKNIAEIQQKQTRQRIASSIITGRWLWQKSPSLGTFFKMSKPDIFSITQEEAGGVTVL